MDRPLLTISELVDFCGKNLSVVALTYKCWAKIVTYILIVLSPLSSLSAVICIFYFGKINIFYYIFMTISICLLIVMFRIRRKMLKNLPANISLSQLKLSILDTYLRSKQISRGSLEHIHTIIVKEEASAKRTFTFVLPGAAVLLPLWNAFLNNYFTYMTKEATLDFFTNWTVSIVIFSLVWWGLKNMILTLINERQTLLKSINRLIDELLINGYGLEEQ